MMKMAKKRAIKKEVEKVVEQKVEKKVVPIVKPTGCAVFGCTGVVVEKGKCVRHNRGQW